MADADLTPFPLGAHGRFLCTPERPRPRGAAGAWEHRGAEDAGTCAQGCCDRYRCVDCGITWMDEGPD